MRNCIPKKNIQGLPTYTQGAATPPTLKGRHPSIEKKEKKIVNHYVSNTKRIYSQISRPRPNND